MNAKSTFRLPLRALGAILLLAAPVFAAPVFAAEAERHVERTFAAQSGLVVELENLAGNVELAATPGTEIRVTGTVHAEGPSQPAADLLAGQLQVTFEEKGGKVVVKGVYPLDEYRKYHYPRHGSTGNDPWFLSWIGASGSSFKYAGREVRVVGSPGGGAATLYADFRLELPAGVGATVKNGVGLISSDGITGKQILDISSGGVRAERGSGELLVDTGSGDVEVRDHHGDVSADTGSGDVLLERVMAQKVDLDTGSGDVRLVDVAGSISADTGSGDVTGENLAVGASLVADTGSGDVKLAGDLSAIEKLSIDTGSGNVTLEASRPFDAKLDISTGSGDIDIDVAGLTVHLDHDDFHGKLGSGKGIATIETGSGDVVLRGK